MRSAVCTLAAILLCIAGLACAADLEPTKPDQAAPAAPQPLQSSDTPAVPGAAAEKPSDDTKLDGLQKPQPETPKADAPKPDDNWWRKLVRDAPNCKSFSDGCRTCSSNYVCSNIGIACQPKEWACNDVPPAAKPDAKSDSKPDAKPDAKP